MAQFTVRVELHGATGDDYENLHAAMEGKGFKRYIIGTNDQGESQTYQLPTAEYDYTASASVTSVRVLAKGVADAIRPNSWVLVTEVADRSWHLKMIS